MSESKDGKDEGPVPLENFDAVTEDWAMGWIEVKVTGKSMEFYLKETDSGTRRRLYVTANGTFEKGVQLGNNSVFLKMTGPSTDHLHDLLRHVLKFALAQKDVFDDLIKVGGATPQKRLETVDEMIALNTTTKSTGVDLSAFLKTREDEEEVLRNAGGTYFLERGGPNGLKVVLYSLSGEKLLPKAIEGKTFEGEACMEVRAFRSKDQKQFKIDFRIISIRNILLTGESLATAVKRKRDDQTPALEAAH